jgi:hypothetical protein
MTSGPNRSATAGEGGVKRAALGRKVAGLRRS